MRNNSNSLIMNVWAQQWKVMQEQLETAGVGAMVIVQDGRIKYDNFRKKNVIYSTSKTKFHII